MCDCNLYSAIIWYAIVSCDMSVHGIVEEEGFGISFSINSLNCGIIEFTILISHFEFVNFTQEDQITVWWVIPIVVFVMGVFHFAILSISLCDKRSIIGKSCETRALGFYLADFFSRNIYPFLYELNLSGLCNRYTLIEICLCFTKKIENFTVIL